MVSSTKVAVIGCGYWGKNLVRVFSEIGNLAAVCDANAELAELRSKEFNVPILSIDQILNSNDIQGVVIAAPAIQHAALAKQALLAGKHVFVEKPLALNVEEAFALSEMSRQVNKVLMVGHLLHYHPGYLELKDLVAKGTIGEVRYIYSNRLSLGKVRTEENSLWSFAPHDISMILGIAGELPEWVQAQGSAFLNPQIEDITIAHMAFRNGVKAHVHVSWLHPFKEHRLVVVGESGMMVFDDVQPWGQKLQIYPHQVKWVNGLPIAEKADAVPHLIEVAEPLKQECLHFIESIENNEVPRTDGFEGTRVLQVLDAAQKSLKTKDRVQVSAIKNSYYKHETAIVDDGCQIGQGTKIWHFSHVIKGTVIGEDCVIGQNVMIGPDVTVGNRCKVQNNVSLYKGVVLEDGVFCGPSCVFTNVFNPRSEIERKDEFRKTYVEKGVSIGANATIVCGTRLGAYSFIGAGAVVIRDVKPHAVIVGNPGRQIGWMSHAGEKLGPDLVCPREGRRYRITEDNYLEEITNESTTSKAG